MNVPVLIGLLKKSFPEVNQLLIGKVLVVLAKIFTELSQHVIHPVLVVEEEVSYEVFL